MTPGHRALLAYLCAATLVACSSSRPRSVVRTPEANPEMIQLPAPTGGDERLHVVTWNVKKLGRASFDLRNKDLLDDADVITFQEVNPGASAVRALAALAAGISVRTGHRVCMGLSELPSGGRERYGYLWRDDRIAFVRRDGGVVAECPPTAVTIRLGVENADQIVREPAFATLVFRPNARPFVLASIHLVPRRKDPRREVSPLFATFRDVRLPVVVAGDYNLDAGSPAFAVAHDLGFVPALLGVKTSIKRTARAYSEPFDNLWTRGLNVLTVEVLDVFRIFEDLDVGTIFNSISDHAPVAAVYTFP